MPVAFAVFLINSKGTIVILAHFGHIATSTTKAQVYSKHAHTILCKLEYSVQPTYYCVNPTKSYLLMECADPQ